ncbi:MAG: DUF839 domain-containing protein [Saprospiraceae bacterium]|nr:DUF839 domain-containing protein [Saprospiraceae bacterium]
MKQKLLLLTLLLGGMLTVNAQNELFDQEIQIPAGYQPATVLLPPSPLTMQVLFVGGHDLVQTTPTYGNEAGIAIAKEWHDFIGFTPDNTGQHLGWVSVNHEMIYQDNRIGDGGGMTVFAVDRDPVTGELVVANQDLTDGRSGKFFNVDFANTVGETGMNCGGISSIVDGRIWTAEEWFRTNNASINSGGYSAPTSSGSFPKSPGAVANQGVRDTADYTISSDIAGFDGLTVKKYENFNWMVEIDPREAKAIRKQYNWGRQGFEGGTIAADNKTVYLGVDGTPAPWVKFVADAPGDFTKGKIYVYKHDASGNKWIEIDNTDPTRMLNFTQEALAKGASIYNRLEWVAIDPASGLIYMTETGNDNPVNGFTGGVNAGGVMAPHHTQRALLKGLTGATDAAYRDYYGRVLKYDPTTEEVSVLLEGGPELSVSPDEANYPSTHFTNPDGLNVITIDGQSFLIIDEDINGSSFGRLPAGVTSAICESFLLNLAKTNPTIDDLIRLTATPRGAEVTGAVMTPDGKSLLLNCQHPNSNLAFPFNHSLTFAIHGFDQLTVTGLQDPEFDQNSGFQIYPNPTTRRVHMNKVTDAALYNESGQRVRVFRNTDQFDVFGINPGTYFVQSAEGEITKLIIQ